MSGKCKTLFGRITSHGRKPKTAYVALRQARDLLLEEGRWTKGSLFDYIDTKGRRRRLDLSEDLLRKLYEDPTCGSWGCCAAGAVQMVVGAVEAKICKIKDEYSEEPYYDYEIDDSKFANPNDEKIYLEAMWYLTLAISGSTVHRWDSPDESIVFKYNDGKKRTRDDVIAVFERAMDIASGKIKVTEEFSGMDYWRTSYIYKVAA